MSGPDIEDSMITSKAVAVARGRQWLDDPDAGAYWKTREYTLKVPHKADITPGDWISVTCSRLGLSASKLRVVNYSVGGDGSQIKWATVTARQFLDPTTGAEASYPE